MIAVKNQERIRCIRDKDFSLVGVKPYKYQMQLTEKLDMINSQFNQQIINEIVLWKVNRYAVIKEETLKKINLISPKEEELNESVKAIAKEVLVDLIGKTTKGVQLPVASTILRFRNPKLFQIIDQRIFRILYGSEGLRINKKNPIFFLSLPDLKRAEHQIQIDSYFKYLHDLKTAAIKLKIEFSESDRILYMADKRINNKFPLKNYGSKMPKGQ